jgi:hypothetical protein
MFQRRSGSSLPTTIGGGGGGMNNNGGGHFGLPFGQKDNAPDGSGKSIKMDGTCDCRIFCFPFDKTYYFVAVVDVVVV